MIASMVFAAATALAADGLREVKNVDYVEGQEYQNGKDRLDLYFPEESRDVPVVVFFHGGGLRQGDRSGSEHVGRALAGAGVGAVVPSYRLSPAVSHPAHVEDAARAVAWTRRHAAEYGGDPRRIYLSGHSAGGYLAALLATDERYLKAEGLSLSDLAGVVPISGFFWVEKVAPDRPKDVWGSDETQWPEASPARFVTAGVPPMLLLYADGDDEWRRRQNEEFAAVLKKAGQTKAAAAIVSGRDHMGIFTRLGPGDPAFERLIELVQKP